MAIYRNIMESIVEEKYDEIKDTLDCCQCEQCRSDVIAFALNHLPAKYVVTRKGELYAKYSGVGEQYRIDILSQLAQGVSLVRQHPNHENGEQSE